MVAPHPDSLAFHHKPVNGEAAEVSMVNVSASARNVPASSHISVATKADLTIPFLPDENVEFDARMLSWPLRSGHCFVNLETGFADTFNVSDKVGTDMLQFSRPQHRRFARADAVNPVVAWH